MAKNAARIDFSGLLRANKLVDGLSAAQISQLKQRATSTLGRRLATEASRQIAGTILNLSQTKVRQSIVVTNNNSAVTVSASRTRLPLSDFGAKASRAGVTATTWIDSGPKFYPHAFKRSDAPGIWQRIPQAGATKQYANRGTGGKFGLVGRLPIVQLKGPAMNRVFHDASGGRSSTSLTQSLAEFGQSILSDEISRLIKVAFNG